MAERGRDVPSDAGARWPLPLEPRAMWELITSPRGMRAWLGELVEGELRAGTNYRLKDGTTGEVRDLSEGHLRMTWQPGGWPQPSTLEVRVRKARGGAIVDFYQEHLPDAPARTTRKHFFHSALVELDRLARGMTK